MSVKYNVVERKNVLDKTATTKNTNLTMGYYIINITENGIKSEYVNDKKANVLRYNYRRL